MTRIWISRIEKDRMQDGPGPRTVVWLEGCSIRCPGCQNKELWGLSGPGMDIPSTGKAILEIAGDQPLTITGGEPFDQVDALADLLGYIRANDREYAPDIDSRRHIIVYTGHTWETLLALGAVSPDVSIADTLLLTDVLVDGPYVRGLDHDHIQWRGSSNQRPIVVWESLGQPELVLEDWDIPIIDVDANGATLTGGLAEDLGLAGSEIARCGEQED